MSDYTPSRFEACALAKIIDGQPMNGYFDRLTPEAQELAGAILAEPSPTRRAAAFDAALAGLSNGPAIRAAVVAADPGADLDELAPKPQPDPGSGDMPELPESARLDPALGADVCPWLDLYTDYARKVSPMTPAIFHESAALWLACVAIARRLMLPMPYGEIYPNLFIAWVANSTLYHKTTALNVARAAARDAFPHLLAPQDTTPEAFLSDLAGQQPANYASMSLPEQQAWSKGRNFAAQRGWVVDEISGLMAGAGKDYNAGLLESLLRFYDCDEIFTRSTKKEGRVVVKNSYLALLGASTPTAMSLYLTAERLWGLGWWPRFAILTPTDERPAWQDATRAERPERLINDLARLYKRLPVATYPNFPTPETVYLGEGVYSAWQIYNRAMSYDLLTPELDTQLWATYGRLPTMVLKIAMILAALEWPEGGACQIELPQLARAMAIAETWRESAHRAKAGANDTGFDQIKKRILKQIAKYPAGANISKIYRGMQDKTPSEIDLALSDMVLAGLVEKVDPEPGKKGRPAERYKIVTE